MEKKIYNLIILDESGSMMSIKSQAISGLNETMQTIRDAQEKYEDQSHYVTLVSFNTNKVKTIYDCCPVHRIQELDYNDYQPSACTPLYDAMGVSLSQLKSVVKDEDNVLVTIITDGYENASREYSDKAITQLVESLKAKGWVFAYIGANQDVEKVATSMGIRNSLCFDANPEGTREMLRQDRECRRELYCCIDEGMDVRELSEHEFFGCNRKNTQKESSEKKEEKKKKKWWWL
jgi:Mg-chelatase subunit ChlD